MCFPVRAGAAQDDMVQGPSAKHIFTYIDVLNFLMKNIFL